MVESTAKVTSVKIHYQNISLKFYVYFEVMKINFININLIVDKRKPQYILPQFFID